MCTRSREKRSECGAGILLSSGNTEKMDLVTEVKDTDSDEWTRVSVTITIASQTEVTTAFFLDNMQGWAYFPASSWKNRQRQINSICYGMRF